MPSNTQSQPSAVLPTDAKTRKGMPITTGVIDYFPLALAAVAVVSRAGNEQHNPGQRLHWAKEKSTDHADCIARHLIERGGFDTDGGRHSAKLAWRSLALLEMELEAEALGLSVEQYLAALASPPAGRGPTTSGT